MPRSQPTQVITHRIEFGSLERTELKQTLDAYQTQLKINNVIGGVTAVGTISAILGVGYLGFLGVGAIAQALGYAGDVIEKVKDGAEQAVFGKESITSAQTGQTIENPLHDIPIIGGLFGLGMDIGNRYSDFSIENPFSNPLDVFKDPKDVMEDPDKFEENFDGTL